MKYEDCHEGMRIRVFPWRRGTITGKLDHVRCCVVKWDRENTEKFCFPCHFEPARRLDDLREIYKFFRRIYFSLKVMYYNFLTKIGL